MKISQDAEPWGLIYAAQNARHQHVVEQLLADRRLLVQFVLRSTVYVHRNSTSDIVEMCKVCCSKGWVDKPMIEKAITSFERDSKHYKREHVEKHSGWFRSNIELWQLLYNV